MHTPSGIALPLAVLWLACALSCGYVGDPLPPALNIPGRITDLRAFQRGEKLVVRFTIPELTTEGLAVARKLRSVELRAGNWGREPFNADAWTARARLLEATAPRTGANEFEFPAAAWTDQEVFIRARALNNKGRAGDWSDFARLRVVQPLQTPEALTAEAVPEGVGLSWRLPAQPSGLVFRILRRAGDETTPSALATTSGSTWIDSSTVYGTRYEYSVVAILNGAGIDAESEISAAVDVLPEDRFPPSVPSDLEALAGPESVELTWERNSEADLAGYRVYRSAGDQPLSKIADLTAIPGFSDRAVERGRRYRYAVSSVDRTGNESAPSPPIEIMLP